MDGISLFLVLLSTLLTPICILASWKYIEKRVKEFLFCLLFMETACVGVFSALDFVLFYIFCEAMLVPMYLLIAVWGGPDKVYASIKFFIYTMAGSVFLMVAMIALYVKTGTFSIPELMTHTYSFNFQFWVFLAFGNRLRHQGPHGPFPYLVAGRPCGGPDRRQCHPGQRIVENGDLRFCALLLAHHSPRPVFTLPPISSGCPSSPSFTAGMWPWGKVT